MIARISRTFVATLFALAVAAAPAAAQKKYDPGATDSEIKIGNIMPYSGAFAEYGATGRAEAAYFHMINDRGGVNGRKITFISVDGGVGGTQAAEQARKLVEQDQVLLIFGSWGLPTNLAIRPYLNDRKVPQLFIAANASIFDDPSHFPWTMGFEASKRTEGALYASYILRTKPAARIALLYAGDAAGSEWREGVHEGLADKASRMIVKEASFDYADPATLGAAIVALKNSGADVFLDFAVGRFATEAIRQAYDIGWRPLQFIPNASLSIAAFLDPAGLEKAAGIITNVRSKGWLTPQEQQDPAAREFVEWMTRYNPAASLRDANNVYGYEAAQTLVEVLRRCGNELTRANVMKQATSLDLELGMLIPGIRVTTSPTDYRPIKQLFLRKFDGGAWVPLGIVRG
jgi:branched-chain amino acid transport system substrate-binding protein